MDSNDLMADLLSSDTFSPVQKVVTLPDPDAQLEQVLNTPGITPADVEFSRQWVAEEKERRLTLVKEWVKERHSMNADAIRDVDARIFEVNQQANDVHDRVRKAAYGTVREVAGELKSLKNEAVVLERLIDSIEQRESMVDALAADPVGTFTDFYRRFPALAVNLPSLWDALSDRRDAQTRPALRSPSFI